MAEALALMHAVLAEPQKANFDRARRVLMSALEAGIDPLAHIVHRLDLSEAQVYRRAAHHCGMAFSPVVPANSLLGAIAHVDGLAQIRSARGRVMDRELVYLAPGFFQFVALRRHVARHPEASRSICIVPPRVLRASLAERHTPALIESARLRLFRLWPRATAHLEPNRLARIRFVFGLALLAILAVVAPILLQPVLVSVLAILLLFPALFRLAALGLSLDIRPPPQPPPLLADDDLPNYSILVPLRDEAGMVPRLAEALRRLDYPSDRLDIKFVVEAESPATVRAVEAELATPHFELIVVPAHKPATKPKALNYALPFVRGDIVVVYDAEDVPDPDQLRRAAARFAAEPELACLQAELVIENAERSWLTALFAAEYAGLFGVLLPALAHWRLPLPLGGTSNHFRADILRQVGGWDAFNVTEDADIGVRLARLGLRSATFTSQTREEAPVTVRAWIKQRARWLKGWMQTFLVHNADFGAFVREAGWRNVIAFEIHLIGMILSGPLHTLFLLSILLRLILIEKPALMPSGGCAMAELTILLVGYMSAMALSARGLIRLKLHRYLWMQILLPFYWVLLGFSGIKAGHELLTKPHFWAKTEHGTDRPHRRRRRRHIPTPSPAPIETEDQPAKPAEASNEQE